jgi:outer membrane protein OmpA-like peptidoglycan-associated protein
MYSVPEVENDKEALFRRAICNYNTSRLDNALQDINRSIRKGKDDEQVIFYLAKIYHSYGEFEKAIKHYKDYLRKTGSGDPKRKSVINDIKRCATGLKVKYKDQLGFIENLGNDFNSRYEEINLLQSPNFSNKYYYSSNRERSTGGRRDADGNVDESGFYYFDMYSASYENGIWVQTETLNPLLNSSKHEFILDFVDNGNILYYASGSGEQKNTILTDTFRDNRAEELFSTKFLSPIVGEYGDKYLSFFNDSTILFSSKREGGYGGYDIYIVGIRNGLWSEPKNLGPSINTPYDEVSAFISPNGLDIYFSSNNTRSTGGFDIFKASYNREGGKWNPSENLGMPVNSAEDDMYFKLTSDGISATFCSNRKTGFGGMDGYILYLKDQAYTTPLVGELPFIEEDQFIASSFQPVRMSQSRARIQKVSNKEKRPEVEIQAELPEPEKEKVVVTKLNLSPLYYGEEENMIFGENKKKLDQLIFILKKFPQLKLELICNTLKEGITAYDLYYSIKRSDKIGEYIIENGIDPQRLLLKGAGSNYPVAKFGADGRSTAMADRVNRRVDVILHNYEDLPLELSIEEPSIVEYLRDKRNGIYKTIVEGLSYKVQIVAVNRMYQNDILKYYSDSMIEKDMNNGKYLYTIGLYEDYFSAKELYKDLKANDVAGILIIPYKNGVRISRNKIIDHAREFPDLVNYLQYND